MNITREYEYNHMYPNVESLMKKLKTHNYREYLHSYRVMDYAIHIGQRLALESDEMTVLRGASLLHDIGKLNINNNLLDKVDPLSEQERLEIKKHTRYGFELLECYEGYETLRYSILTHHERCNGSGYPQALKKKHINIYARIIAVADSFDAMITIRPYKGAMSVVDACSELVRCANIEYDPDVVRALCEYIFDSKSFRSLDIQVDNVKAY